MIEEHWKRIAGLHALENGDLAVVWLVRNPDTDQVTCYDTALFKREVLAVIIEGIAARGRWIPIAWAPDSKEIVDKLRDRGLDILPEPSRVGNSMTEVISRDLWERMRTGRFKVDKRLGAWLDEMKSFSRRDSKVPTDTHPLMMATLNAMAMIDFARSQSRKKKIRARFQDAAIV